MRVSSRLPATALALGAVAVVFALVLSGCSPTGAASTRIVPKTEHLYPALHAYPGVTLIHNLVYDTVDGTAVKLDICLPKETNRTAQPARPAIVSIHGGSWAYGTKDDPNWQGVCEWLAYSGYVVASLSYGLAPVHTFPVAITEVEHAVEWLRKPAQDKRFNIDPTLIGAFGGSAGGNLASLLGTTGSGSTRHGHRVAAVAELSGPEDLTRAGPEQKDFYPYVLSYLDCPTFVKCPPSRAQDSSPLYHVDASDPPFFVGHSTDDRIPLAQAVAFVKKLRATGVDVTFVTVKGHEHSIAMLDLAMRTRVIAFFRAKLVHLPFDVVTQ